MPREIGSSILVDDSGSESSFYPRCAKVECHSIETENIAIRDRL